MSETTEETAVAQLIHYRELHECSQAWVADAMRGYGHKWSQATVWAVEKRQRRLQLNEVGALAEIFDVPLSDFLRPDDTSWFQSQEDAFNVAAEATNKFKRAAEEAAEATAIYHSAVLRLSRGERDGLPTLPDIWDRAFEEAARRKITEQGNKS